MTLYRPYLNVIVLMSLASLLITMMPQVRLDPAIGVALELPEDLDGYTGVPIAFCQNGRCQKVLVGDEIPEEPVCVRCGADLAPVSFAESFLPQDTIVAHRYYVAPGGTRFYVTQVISGPDRRSIHRPQNCLPGQGYEIRNERRVVDNSSAGDPFAFKLMDVDNPGMQRRFQYAYWYVGPDFETSSQFAMMGSMARSRVLTGRAERWAYLSVFTETPGGLADQDPELADFVNALRARALRQSD